ncbi:hypothetical protein A2G06_16955 (plasmid) [Geobacter anodireducens]|nr:hypothetical protein A2G06_16955 [Geobacter anodireducens]
MIRDNELVGLCQVIARDSGMEVTVGGKKSYITDDGCRLNIAAMPMTPEGRLVAVGLGFHEVGHKLYSDISSDWGHGLQHDLTNIIEDVRETRDFIKDRPGVAYDIEKAVNWYQEAGSYTPSDLNTAIRALALGVGYVDLLGFPSLVPELALAREIISSEMGDGFLSLAEMILKKYPKMSFGKEGTAESIEMAKALCNLLEEEAKKKEQEEQGQKQQGQQQKQDDHQDQPSQGESSEEEEQKAEPSEGEMMTKTAKMTRMTKTTPIRRLSPTRMKTIRMGEGASRMRTPHPRMMEAKMARMIPPATVGIILAPLTPTAMLTRPVLHPAVRPMIPQPIGKRGKPLPNSLRT